MSEVRGYPNPNYRMQDVCPETLEMNAQILMDGNEYRELAAKAAALDILTADIKAKIDTGSTSNYDLVNDAIVLAVTGMGAYKRRKEFEATGKVDDD